MYEPYGLFQQVRHFVTRQETPTLYAIATLINIQVSCTVLYGTYENE